MKRKHVVFAVLIMSLSLISHSQDWDWYKHFANPGTITNPNSQALTVSSVKIDASNNIVVYGQFKDTLIVEGVVYESSGAQDLFLAKYSQSGVLQWMRILGGTDEEISGNLTLDAAGNAYITGAFRSTTDFQGFTITADDKRDIFLAKVTASGNVSWLSHAVGGVENQVGFGVAVAPNGEVYLSGTFKQEAVFDSQTFTAQKANTNNFVAKYDASGNEIWSQQVICSNNNTRLFEIDVYTNSEIYLAGFFTDTLEYNTQQAVSQSTSEDIIVIKITNLGIPVWARQAGSTSVDRCNGIDSDRFGAVYLTGYITSAATFDSTGLGAQDGITLNSAGGYDLFVAKYNKNGTLQWASRNGNSGNDIGYGVSTYENIVQFSGYFSDEVIFNLDTLRSTGPGDQNTGFFVYNTSGDPINGREMKGPDEERGSAITFDISESATYVGGMFNSDTLTFGSNQIIKTSGNQEGFVAKYFNPFTATFTKVTPINCAGDNNGRLIVTPYFGVSPYTYTWSGNVSSSIDSLAQNLTAGTYSVTITDSRAESASNVITLADPDPLAIDSIVTDVSCHPSNGISNNGSIDLTVTGGTVAGAYSYNWTAIAGSGVNATSEDQFTLTAGVYRVLVRDDNLCSLSDTFYLSQPDEILFAGSIVTNASGGGSDGAINLNVSGGNDTPPYTAYSWTNDDLSYTATTEDIVGIPGDNYYVTVTDGEGCEGDTGFVVQDLSLLIATITNKTDVDCKGNNTGAATVGITGGTGPYSYAWENSLGNSIGGDAPNITGLISGTYYVTVTDDFDLRTAETSVQIMEPALPLSASINGTNLNCNGNNSGIADLSVSGGTLPYSYTWSNGGSTEDQLDLPAGTFQVTVTDKNLCTANDEVTLTEPAAMDITITVTQAILCNGGVTGVLEAAVTGGVGQKSYVWDDPGNQTSNEATGLSAGLYTVTATDQNGCEVSTNRLLSEPDAILIVPASQDVSCAGDEDGIIALTVSGGTSPFNYQWSSGQISQNIQDLGAGNYTVTVTDANNCRDSLTVALTEPGEILFAGVSTAEVTCAGYSDGQISISGSGGTGALEYSVDAGANYSASGTFLSLAAQVYTLRIRDENDCISADSLVTLSEPEGTTIVSEESTGISCFGDANGSITITASSSAGGLTYSINDGASFIDNGGLFTGLDGGIYAIRVRDVNLCITQGSSIEISEPALLEIDTLITDAIGDQNGSIQVSATGGILPYIFVLLSESDSTGNSDGAFDDLPPGNYSTYVVDDNSCESEILECEIRQTSTDIVIYDAFSPNADGYNDMWNIGNIDLFPQCKVTIFNSWGNQVFSSDGYNEPWDGMYNGSELPSGTYYYVIDLGDGSDAKTGPVSIVR